MAFGKFISRALDTGRQPGQGLQAKKWKYRHLECKFPLHYNRSYPVGRMENADDPQCARLAVQSWPKGGARFLRGTADAASAIPQRAAGPALERCVCGDIHLRHGQGSIYAPARGENALALPQGRHDKPERE